MKEQSVVNNLELIFDNLGEALKHAESHTWFKKSDDYPIFCIKCDVIKRKHGKNKPCKGWVKAELR